MSYQDDEIQALHTDIEDLKIALALAKSERDQAAEAADEALKRVEVEVDRRLWLERRIEAVRSALGQ